MISDSSVELFYSNHTDSEMEEVITLLPEHLKIIFEGKLKEGLSRRHSYFIASSFDWGDKRRD